MMEWLTLTGGLPKEPSSHDELGNTPGPEAFWSALFSRFVKLNEMTNTKREEKEIPRDERIVSGTCGTPSIGYRWTEHTSLDTSMIPVAVTDETYGLQGIDVKWDYRLAQMGQAGRAAFRHGTLRARFADSRAREVFTDAWRNVFGCDPVFGRVEE
jgi:hypothetical protein